MSIYNVSYKNVALALFLYYNPRQFLKLILYYVKQNKYSTHNYVSARRGKSKTKKADRFLQCVLSKRFFVTIEQSRSLFIFYYILVRKFFFWRKIFYTRTVFVVKIL